MGKLDLSSGNWAHISDQAKVQDTARCEASCIITNSPCPLQSLTPPPPITNSPLPPPPRTWCRRCCTWIPTSAQQPARSCSTPGSPTGPHCQTVSWLSKTPPSREQWRPPFLLSLSPPLRSWTRWGCQTWHSGGRRERALDLRLFTSCRPQLPWSLVYTSDCHTHLFSQYSF